MRCPIKEKRARSGFDRFTAPSRHGCHIYARGRLAQVEFGHGAPKTHPVPLAAVPGGFVDYSRAVKTLL
jgi:hypothetical protein